MLAVSKPSITLETARTRAMTRIGIYNPAQPITSDLIRIKFPL